MRASALDDASERAIASHEAEQMSRMGNGIIENGDLPELRVPKRAAQIGEVESVEDSSDESYARNHNQQEAEASQPSSTPSAFELPSKDEAKRIRDEDNKVRDTERNFKRTLPPEILELFHKQSPKSQNGRKLTNQISGAGSNRTGGDASSGEGTTHNVIMDRVWKVARVDSTPIIMLPKDFEPKPGSKLSDDLIVGKHLSSGLQGGVYELKRADGSQAQVVLKWVHKHALLAEVEREWEVGMRLNQLAYQDGSLPGFMGVGAGVRAGGKFRGMLLERLNGTTVDRIVCTKNFHDIHYVYDLLYSVFTALDRAQGALGFHHSDLRLANVMEMYEDDDDKEQKEEIVNARTSRLNPPTPIHSIEQTRGSEGPSDDSARHMFKIIDYGLANFEETFAAGPDVSLDDDERFSTRKSITLQRQNSISPATGCVAVFPFPMMRKDKLGKLPSPSPIEKLYRFMWRRKGDVYHLVFELGEWLDGRVWPEEDEVDVLRLVALVHHVTGVKIKCWFSSAMSGDDSVAGWRDRRGCGPFERHDSAMHFLRRWDIRLRSWLNPSNPGLTAAEALTAPLFTKRVSLRGVIHGCSTKYSKWTRVPSQRKKRASESPRKGIHP